MPPSTDFVVRRLQEILAREAATHFPSTVIQADVADYIKHLTQVVDWEDDFLSDVYDLYLRKITDTGKQLSDNFSGSSSLIR